MKCPKCDYLGFDTGDRCKNCGYDFSLSGDSSELTPDLDLKLPGETGGFAADVSAFPLFPSVDADDDEPLITVPSRPRPPLAVRRTPDLQRRRASPRAVRLVESDLVLDFATEAPDTVPTVAEHEAPARDAVAVPATDAEVAAGLPRRAVAAVTDHAILFSVDLVVIYCTLRIVGLTTGDWLLLPALPLLTFLILLKLAYFSAFTAMGGQTIGKMAAGIRVVADGERVLDPARALRRTLTGAVAVIPFGIGLVPALFDPARRALHDRVAHTRVVELPSA